MLDGLSASAPPFKLIQLSSHLIPGIAEGVDATHSFQMSMLLIPLQSDVERILLSTMDYYPARKADDEGFKALTDAAYIYLKTCYLARNHAVGALSLSDAQQEEQHRQMDALLEKMAVLSVNYGRTPENAYDKHHRLIAIENDADLIEASFQTRLYPRQRRGTRPCGRFARRGRRLRGAQWLGRDLRHLLRHTGRSLYGSGHPAVWARHLPAL